MITTTLKETWGVVKATLKRKFTELSDNDLAYILGREEEMIQHIQTKTGLSRDQLLRIMRNECGCNC